MLISTVVHYAEAVTGVLALALCLRIYLLYRAFVAKTLSHAPVTAVVRMPAQPATPNAILEEYIGELLGADNIINSLPEPRLEETVQLAQPHKEAAYDIRQLPPFNPQSYQPITAFLANRCEVQQAS
ncbi:hypothetical protein [Mangrovitalea sediminis]|uniref:hypothetical protein n=1 Tax=Mangrovitalea sediminis TaxID=1982043 RepID=UPI000BE5BE0B|nr:hypothetical protein [Mangrovitalea sediminis]